MIKATLVTPFPPQQTGLADYALRILSLTRGSVDWTVAYPSTAQPVEGYRCVPLSHMSEKDFGGTVVYQVGNSPHCEEVNEALLAHGGIGLFHETNMHHVLRNRAHNSGQWSVYEEHVKQDYGQKAEAFLKLMGKKAKSLSEYDERLRKNPLVGKLVSACSTIAVLSDTAKRDMEKLASGRKVLRMNFLPDFLESVQKPVEQNDQIVIGVAGTFHYGRSWEEMISTVALLRRKINCRMLVVGGGWPKTEHKWIETTGRLPDREFRETIQKFDIALDLRHHTCGETSGSMMDMLRSGIPAVVTDQGSFRDLPADAVLRIPSDSGAAGAFAAVDFLLNNQELRSSISLCAKKYFAEVSDPGKCLRQWFELLSGGES